MKILLPLSLMQDIEPYYRWRDDYIASEDEASPMYGHINNEEQYTHLIYDHYIHPQWDFFGSETLYLKILYVDYDLHYCIIEFIGEWNDAVNNDVMHFKRNVVDSLMESGITKFILATENVLNFHGSDDCYYEEWQDEVANNAGWICYLNTQQHVTSEMEQYGIQRYVNLGSPLDNVIWRNKQPEIIHNMLDEILSKSIKQLYY